MTVVKFPDEIFRIILNKLDQEPKFKIYLGALEKCIQRDLDVEPLIQWWNKNCSRIGYDDAELEFLDTIDRVKLGNRSWNEEKIFRIKEHEKILKKYHKDKLNRSKSDLRSVLSVADELVQILKDDENNRNAWGLDNPEYKSTLWMKEWVPLFTSIYGDNGPLGIIAKRFDGFFDNKIVSDWNDTKRNTEPMPMKEFRYTLLDKPIYIAFESDAHHLLMNISNWIGKERKNLANLVFSYLLTSPEEKTKFNMLDLLNAALTCTH